MDYFEIDGEMKHVEDLTKEEFGNMLSALSDLYFNNPEEKNKSLSVTVDDSVYDSLVEMYTLKFGKYGVVGAPVSEKYREKLPKYLGSLDKVKTEKELSKWTKKYKGPYVVTDKIDGVSAEYNGKKLWTRGDGNEGTNISHVLKYLSLPKLKEGIVRGELAIPRDVFEEKWKDTFSNIRNMISGILNPFTKNPNKEALGDLEFLAYEYDDKTYTQSQSQQLDILEELGFTIPGNEIIVDDLSVENLTELMKKNKSESNFDMDGLVIVNDEPVPAVTRDNPLNAVAFKIEGEVVITEVERVEWNASKLMVLKPRVNFKEVSLCGVKINWATGHNAKFIVENKIGPGAKIMVTRSGDVIPYIKEVVEQADETSMPDEDYEWNETGVDIILLKENEDVKLRKIEEFFKTLKAKFVGRSTIEKMYSAGINTLKKIFNVTVDELVKIDGIQKKGADRIVEAVKLSITNVPLYLVSAASGVMGKGLGKRKMESVTDVHPDILDKNLTRDEMITLLKGVGGFQKTADQFADNLIKLKTFLKDHPEITLKRQKPIKGKSDTKGKKEVEIVFEFDDDEDENKELEDEELEDEENKEENKESLDGKIVVFTGVRDAECEDTIKEKGGKVTTSISGKTSILVVAQRYGGTSKETKAEQLGVEILTLDEFKLKYI